MAKRQRLSGDEDGDRRRSSGGAGSRDRRTYGSSSPRSRADGGDSDEPSDENERHFVFRAGDMLNARYRAVSLLGTGTFGRVILARDTYASNDVALKVVRAIRKYSKEAIVEANILSAVHARARERRKDPPIVQLLDRFEHRGHVCLAFEQLGPTLLEALEAARRPHRQTASSYFCLAEIQSIASGIFSGLDFLHQMELSHTDLKPENVLLCSALTDDGRLPQSVRVKLIDFGGATFAHEHHSDVVCTRQYRPPEVTLGVAWGTAVDLWSAACILAELYTGRVLFATHDEAEHLAMMERSLGTLPQRMARRASERAKRWWLKHNSLLWPEIAPSPRSVRRVRETPRLRDFLQRDRPWVRLHDSFLHLLSQLLEWDPRARISALEALQHPFMQAEELRRGVFL